MPKHIDKIRKEMVKSNKYKGYTDKEALLKAGYSKTTAEHHVGDIAVLKRVKEEIMEELRARDVTVDMVIQRLNEDRQLAKAKGDTATMTKVDELLGKYLAMWTEKRQIDANIMTQEERTILDKYISGNRLRDKGMLT